MKSSLEDLEAKNIIDLKESKKVIKSRDFNEIIETYKYPLSKKNEIINLILNWYDNINNFKESGFRTSLIFFTSNLNKKDFEKLIEEHIGAINRDKGFNFEYFIKENNFFEYVNNQNWEKTLIIFEKLEDDKINFKFMISNIEMIKIILVAGIQTYKERDDKYENRI